MVGVGESMGDDVAISCVVGEGEGLRGIEVDGCGQEEMTKLSLDLDLHGTHPTGDSAGG